MKSFLTSAGIWFLILLASHLAFEYAAWGVAMIGRGEIALGLLTTAGGAGWMLAMAVSAIWFFIEEIRPWN
jgi:hypothetical protein